MALKSWLQAARAPAQINIALPLILGQLLACQQAWVCRWDFALLLVLYGLAMQLYIVFWNDWADRDADVHNPHPTIFSGGSRVLTDGLLAPRELFIAGAAAAVAVLALGYVFTRYLDRPWTLLLFAAGTFLLWAYSIPPLRLNYRFGGELLQALGVGLLLPHIGYYVQANTFADATHMLPFFLHQLAIAIAFTLPDRDADKNTDKCTLATWIGTKHAAEFAVFLGVLAQFILFITHSKDFAVLNLPSLPLLCSFFLLPKLTPSNKTALAQKTAHKFLLAFVALTIARGVFYILAIYLHDDLQ